MKDMKQNISKMDYLEILDMNKDELLKYTKEELIDALQQLASELYDMEKLVKE